MDGEIGQQLLYISPKLKFQVDVYNVVFDTAISSFEKHFNISSKLMADLACLHPSRFREVQQLSAEPFERLSNYLKKFDPSITSLELFFQLKDCAEVGYLKTITR